MHSLGTIRARVERLASVWPTSPETTFITWIPPFTRCPSCNGLLVEVAKDEVSDLLPDGTRRSYDQFSRCPQCGRIYWRGAHSDSLESIVATHRPPG